MYYKKFLNYEIQNIKRRIDAEYSDFEASFSEKTNFDFGCILGYIVFLVFVVSLLSDRSFFLYKPFFYYILIIVITALIIGTMIMVYYKDTGKYIWRFIISEIMFLYLGIDIVLCLWSFKLENFSYSLIKLFGIFWGLMFMIISHSKIKYLNSYFKRS